MLMKLVTLQIFMRNLVSLESPWMHIFCLKGFQNLVWEVL